MSKFMLLYRGNATPMEDMTPEQGEQATALWGAWMEKHGSAVADLGAPFGARSSVGGDGSEQTPANLNGSTVVDAENIEAAKAFCDGHPFLHGTGADFAVDVFQLVPVEM